MMNLIIRLISFAVCVGLLIAGITLTIGQTMKNDKLWADVEQVNNAKWLPESETVQEEETQTPDGGDQTTDGGDQIVTE